MLAADIIILLLFAVIPEHQSQRLLSKVTLGLFLELGWSADRELSLGALAASPISDDMHPGTFHKGIILFMNMHELLHVPCRSGF